MTLSDFKVYNVLDLPIFSVYYKGRFAPIGIFSQLKSLIWGFVFFFVVHAHKLTVNLGVVNLGLLIVANITSRSETTFDWLANQHL